MDGPCSQTPRIFVGIPVLNRLDLLIRCIEALDYPNMQILVINNSRDKQFRADIEAFCKPRGIDLRHQIYNLGVSASWNKIIAYGMGWGYDHVYIGSNDTILNPGTLQKVEALQKDPNDVMWHIHGWNFWCISVNAIPRVGWFDENFYPAYCEDVDYAYRCDCLAENAGRVYVGTDGNDAWSHLQKVKITPIQGVGGEHLGSQTINSDRDYGRMCSATMYGSNVPHFHLKWGGGARDEKFRTPYNDPKNDFRWWPDPEPHYAARDWDLMLDRERQGKASQKETASAAEPKRIPSSVETLYQNALKNPDIGEHVSLLMRYASSVRHITELGNSWGCATAAFLRALPKTVVAYADNRPGFVDDLRKAAEEVGVAYCFTTGNPQQATIDETDLLFIDTWHTYEYMRDILGRHAGKARRWIVMHDTETFGLRGESSEHGVWPAIMDFLREHPEWEMHDHREHNNGLTVLRKRI